MERGSPAGHDGEERRQRLRRDVPRKRGLADGQPAQRRLLAAVLTSKRKRSRTCKSLSRSLRCARTAASGKGDHVEAALGHRRHRRCEFVPGRGARNTASSWELHRHLEGWRSESRTDRIGTRPGIWLHGLVLVYSHALRGYAATLPDAALAGIERNPQVLFVFDREFQTAAAPAPCTEVTTCQVLSNGVNRIDGDLSSTRSGDGKGTVQVNVAIIDSGTGPHPDLNVVGGWTARTATAVSTTSKVTGLYGRRLRGGIG